MSNSSILKLSLFTSLSFLVVITSCDKTDVNSIKKISYIYMNESGVDLTMLVFNQSGDKIKEFTISNGSEITSHTTESEGIGIFQFAENENLTGDSVSIVFAGNKCLSYQRSIPEKIFDVKRYDNYSDELIKREEFSLIYTITEDDYIASIQCR